MLCGIGLFYAISLCTADELYRRAWQSRDFVESLRLLALAARIMPFEHRFREGAIKRLMIPIK